MTADRRFSWGSTPPADADEAYLRRAFEMALRGEGTVSPNPMVGAVLVRAGRVVGAGHHRRAGGDHAEVIALRRAGSAARGATLYVNLEPCSHQGRTPPCVDSVLRSGVGRVVASMVDPNPRVRGRGFRALRSGGVRVETGRLQGDARRLNEAYIAFTARRRPFVLLKAGMSLDGRIATASGASKWITSATARREAHRMRWAFDSIGIGLDTLRADDPRLTAIRGGREKERFLRVVLDSRLRAPLRSRLVRSAATRPVRIYTTSAAPAARERRLRSAGVDVRRVASRRGRVDPRPVLEDLGRDDVTSLLLEGGGEVHASFLDAGLVDKVLLYVAPRFLGGRGSIPVVGGDDPSRPGGGFPLRRWTTRRAGGDLVIEGYPAARL